MPCRAHKHWLPRFYAFCCFSGIFPTALMRSLRPCRVGDKSPTLLGYGLPSYLRQACRLLPSFPRRRESIALSSAAVDCRLRGNDGVGATRGLRQALGGRFVTHAASEPLHKLRRKSPSHQAIKPSNQTIQTIQTHTTSIYAACRPKMPCRPHGCWLPVVLSCGQRG